MGIEAIIALGGLIVPPIFDFIKKKYIKSGKDTPEATMASLAVTKPETLGPYVEAMATYLHAQVAYFNRDIVGQDKLPGWVSAVRGLIKPGVIIIGLVHLTASGILGPAIPLDPGVKYFYIAVISSWFGVGFTKE